MYRLFSKLLSLIKKSQSNSLPLSKSTSSTHSSKIEEGISKNDTQTDNNVHNSATNPASLQKQHQIPLKQHANDDYSAQLPEYKSRVFQSSKKIYFHLCWLLHSENIDNSLGALTLETESILSKLKYESINFQNDRDKVNDIIEKRKCETRNPLIQEI